jgi:hypothetical protein
VDDSPVDLGDQPCIGIASEDDPAVPLRRYRMDVVDMARTVAMQAMASVANRTTDPGLFTFAKLDKAQYDITTQSR